jgi:L-seryl-tRNA(Ser) seleniumtransferase
MTPETKDLLRLLPSVSALLEHEEVREWLSGLPRATVVAAVRAAADAAREEIRSGEQREPVAVEDILARAEDELVRRSVPSLRRVVNATGIVLHTGLGRAPLCDAAIEAIVDGASGYCNLEYELSTGRRGRRVTHVVEKLTSITGAEASTVVNNNAAATLLVLQTFAAGREVVVSRGHLIEIGGSYRLPDIMRASGADLCEVGTTNRTRIADYENAINDRTALLLRVHTSNYRIVGFAEETGIDEIASLAHRRGLIAADDLGSGALFDPRGYGLPDEPSVSDSLAAGADLVCFSGDKLLGGPQCGVIVGKRDLIKRIEANPLMRTYRVGKLTLLALEATLGHHFDPTDAVESIPTLSMLAGSTDELAARAGALCDKLKAALPEEDFFVCSSVGYAGGGSMPQRELETVVVHWRPSHASVDEMAAALRDADVPVIAHIRDDALCFDLRTVREPDCELLVASVCGAVWDRDSTQPSDED